MLALVSLAVLASAFVKGAIGFGFPALGTPVLSLLVDVKTAIIVLILPNIVMDGIQLARSGAPGQVVRRMLPVVVPGAPGMLAGTYLLAVLPSRTVTLVLGAFVVLVVVLGLTPLAPRIPPRWERWTSPVAGLLSGVVGGITNVPGTPLVVYFQALGLPKREFVSAVGFTFVIAKLAQLAAVSWYGLMSGTLLAGSALLTVVALAGFALGLRVQDALAPRAFDLAVRAFLSLLGAWLVVRGLGIAGGP